MLLKLVLCLTLCAGWVAAASLPKSHRKEKLIYEYLRATGRPLDDDILEDANLGVMELIAKYGYQGEAHTIQTDDGYILTVHRILPKEGCTPRATPVILQHGLLSSSADWIVMGPLQGLGYLLSDACYDVWMGNSRGNRESKAHSHLAIDSDEYWDFSWHEMGVHDLPTLIDYVLVRTGAEQLYYVGHSQGTTQYFIMDSLKPEYGQKVKAMFALAPIAFMGNSNSNLLKFIAKFEGPLSDLLGLIGVNEFLPGTGLVSAIGGEMCKDEHPNTQWVCENMLFVVAGFDESQTNGTMLPVVMSHCPAGSATKQFLHYAQSMNTGLFRYFDYGKKENQNRYGQNEPPEYPLQNAKSHYVLHYASNDFFANVIDVQTLYQKLPNPIGEFLVPWEQFNHLDFLWAIDVKTFVYDKVMDVMDRG